MSDEADHFSERLGEIIGQEFHRVGRSSDELDEVMLQAVFRIAMRCAYQGSVELAARLEDEGISVDLEPHLIDSEGVDLLLPPHDDAE